MPPMFPAPNNLNVSPPPMFPIPGPLDLQTLSQDVSTAIDNIMEVVHLVDPMESWQLQTSQSLDVKLSQVARWDDRDTCAPCRNVFPTLNLGGTCWDPPTVQKHVKVPMKSTSLSVSLSLI